MQFVILQLNNVGLWLIQLPLQLKQDSVSLLMKFNLLQNETQSQVLIAQAILKS